MTIRVVVAASALALCASVVVSCSRGDGGSRASAPTAAAPALQPPTQPNFYGGPPDQSHSVVMRHPQVQLAMPSVSPPLRDLPTGLPPAEKFEREPRPSPFPFANATQPDPVVQTALAPVRPLVLTVQSFLGQGETLGGCIFPRPDMGEPADCTTTGDPPDTNGVVGPNHYVQTVNGGIAIWDKSGALKQSPRYLNTLWASHPNTDGNSCATENDGDPVVLYDQLADRWFVTQFSLPNYGDGSNPKAPSYQCVAVSQTGDPTGAYYLYDFQYNAVINDYGKFGVWPDAYYASFNNFSAITSQGANVCAYDRVAMLQGQPATQHCFQQSASTFALLPSSLDGMIKPPNGEPGFFVRLRNGTSISLYKFHADFVTAGNTTFTGPTNLPVASYSQLSNSVAQPSPGNALASLGDRPMFHLSYRNFGTLESLVFNHSVAAGSAGGPRWYEIRSPNGTPAVFQQGTFAPADGKYRWMGSIAQDMAQDMALGYSISSSTQKPSIAWTGRTATDAAGSMGQPELTAQDGMGVETGSFKSGGAANRWGDYSNMSVDPTDDCTFWYTNEDYPADGIFNWDTGISHAKFDNCGKNNFTISLAPASDSVAQNGQVTFTVTTVSTGVAAESIALTVQDLPSGVTGAFNPTSVTAGGTSTLTLSATPTAPVTASPATFMVIGKAASAVHAATADLSVVACKKLTMCPSPDDCGTIPDGCGGTVSCGPACTAPNTCGGGGMANVCGCTPTTTMCPVGSNCGTVDNGCGMPITCGPACTAPNTCGGGGTANVCGCTPSVTCPAGANCGSIDNGCGTMVSCGGACSGSDVCVANVCTATPPDLAVGADLSVPATPDLAMMSSDDLSVGDNGDLAIGGGGAGGGGAGGGGGGGGGGGKGGCGCHVGGQAGNQGPLACAFVALGLGLALLRRRARRINVPPASLSGI